MAVRKGTGVKTPAKKTTGSARLSRGKNSSSGGAGRKYPWPALFWLAFIIFIVCLFLYNRETILSSIQSIRSELAARKKPGADAALEPQVIEPKTGIADKSSRGSPVTVRPVTPPAAAPSTQNTTAQSTGVPRQGPASAVPASPVSAAPAQPVTQNTQSLPPPVQAGPAELRERTLYFTQIDRDGSILRIKVNRKLPVSNSPMTDVIVALISGPNTEEERRGLISLIPVETKVLSATVRGETAYISFSEEFQYNTYGVEGYAAQLRQIVYTVTEFSNVRYVQILIEGRRVDYLGEGIWIGSPLDREML